MTRKLLLLACLSGALAVILGAFGAHALTKLLNEAQLRAYDTGIKYQFYHTFAIFITAIASRYINHRWASLAGGFFVAGIICFSGSLYLLAAQEILGLTALAPIIGPITPLGGLLFIIGWLALFRASFDYKARSGSSSKK